MWVAVVVMTAVAFYDIFEVYVWSCSRARQMANNDSDI